MEKCMQDRLPAEKRLDFFVYLIESPSPVDLYLRRNEGEMLQQAINLNKIGCRSRLAVNLEAFKAALDVGLKEEMEIFKPSIPIIHISAHGSSDGIRLTSGEFIEWHHLREMLTPINKKVSGLLVVCMSTCEGYSGLQMAIEPESNEHPFFAIIGNADKPTWSETAIGFATLYHLIAKGFTVVDAVNAMCIASGNRNFLVTTAEETKQGYIEYLKNKIKESENILEIQNNEQNIESESTKKYKNTDQGNV